MSWHLVRANRGGGGGGGRISRVIVPLKYIEDGLGVSYKKTPYTPYPVYLRGTTNPESGNSARVCWPCQGIFPKFERKVHLRYGSS